jgi:hypothetical protein
MADRNLLDRLICVVAALALLVTVLTSPLQSVGSDGILCRSSLPRRHDFTIPPARAGGFILKSLVMRTTPVKAVASESDEEKLGQASPPSWWTLGLLPSSPLKVPASTFAQTPGLTRSLQPLRC